MGIVKPRDYASVSAPGSFKVLPKGGYICRIIKAEATTDKNGNAMLHIAFDICDGDFANYFGDIFKDRKLRADDPKSVKWPFEGQKWISVYDFDGSGKTNRQFKGFCSAVEDSGYTIWSPSDELLLGALNGATVGVIFRKEEQEYNGKTSWRTMPWGFRSVNVIDSGDYFVPEDKPLETKSDYGFPEEVASFNSVDDDLPF